MTFIKSIHRTLLIFIIILMSGLFPSALTAKVFIITEIVSGQVISITKENLIELDDGFLYYPVKEDINFFIKPGQILSIRYYIDAMDKRNYIDLAPGKNSLKAIPVPKSTRTPRSLL